MVRSLPPARKQPCSWNRKPMSGSSGWKTFRKKLRKVAENGEARQIAARLAHANSAYVHLRHGGDDREEAPAAWFSTQPTNEKPLGSSSEGLTVPLNDNQTSRPRTRDMGGRFVELANLGIYDEYNLSSPWTCSRNHSLRNTNTSRAVTSVTCVRRATVRRFMLSCRTL